MNRRERIMATIAYGISLGIKKTEIADYCKVSRTAVTQWSKGDVEDLKYENLRNLAKVCQVSEAWLADEKGPMERGVESPGATYTIGRDVAEAPAIAGWSPEINWVQAGQWQEICDEDQESYNWHPRIAGGDQTFVLRVVGESMMPDYPPGRLIFVDPERSAIGGDDVIAVLTDTNEATFKRLVEEPGGQRMLKALNPDWRDPYLPINGNCRIVGVVVADMRVR